MAELDALTIGQKAARLGLISVEQMEDGLRELGNRKGDPSQYLRVLERKGHLTPWQSSKLLKGDSDGFFLGGYRLLYKIASGSFGRVYRADDPATGVVVAIKVLRNRWTEERHNVELFEREGKVGMGLKHPNIVEILTVNCDPKTRQYYIVMEFVEGGNLRELLKIRNKLNPLETIRILEDAAAGLAYAYSRGVTHRDMKLTNVLISSQGHAKLVDFGLAGLSEHYHKRADLQTDRTVDYAGLEKATNVPRGDIRSDIYFLGCVGYELLTGRSPLEKSKDPYQRMRSSRFRGVKPMSPQEVEAPPSVFRLIEMMMSLEPTERFQTPSQLLDSIRNVRRELEGGAGKPVSVDKTVFIVESDSHLQDTLRNRFKGIGFRVLMSADPNRALDRYRQQPYDLLIVDAGTVEEDGLLFFDRILNEAASQSRPIAGVLILSEHQRDWVGKVQIRPNSAVMVRPVTIKQLQRRINALLKMPAKDSKSSKN